MADDSLSSLHAELDGPVGTPFEGGRFRIRLSLPTDYPTSPPKGCFLTKIFHPNISASGEICVNSLKKDWKATHGLRHVLLVVHCLLIQPNPESALNEEAGKLLMECYEEYERRARLMTRVHAMQLSKGKESKGPSAQSLTSIPASVRAKREGGNGAVVEEAIASTISPPVDEALDGQENQPTVLLNSPQHGKVTGGVGGGVVEGKRGTGVASNGEKGGGEEESKISPPTKRSVVQIKGAGADLNKAKAIKKTIKRL